MEHDLFRKPVSTYRDHALRARAGGTGRGIAARRSVSFGDFIDGEQGSRKDRVGQRQDDGERCQSVEKSSHSPMLDEVKWGQHPHIDVRQAVSRECEIGDDRQYLQRHASARVRKVLQNATNDGVAKQCQNPTAG